MPHACRASPPRERGWAEESALCVLCAARDAGAAPRSGPIKGASPNCADSGDQGLTHAAGLGTKGRPPRNLEFVRARRTRGRSRNVGWRPVHTSPASRAGDAQGRLSSADLPPKRAKDILFQLPFRALPNDRCIVHLCGPMLLGDGETSLVFWSVCTAGSTFTASSFVRWVLE